MSFRKVNNLNVNVNPPRRITDLLDFLLPELCRECLLGDLQERYEMKVLPNYVSQYGTEGAFAAMRWQRRQILASVHTLLVYRVMALLFTLLGCVETAG